MLDVGTVGSEWGGPAALARIGVDAIPPLIEALRLPGGDGRAELAELGLVAMGMEAVPRLVDALADEASSKRAQATLAKISRRSPQAVSQMRKALRAANPATRSAAVGALGECWVAWQNAVPCLVESLKDPDERVRAKAAESLGRLGPCATASRDALVEASTDKAEEVRTQAAQALRVVGAAGADPLYDGQTLNHWVEQLQSKSIPERSRAAAVGALGHFGALARGAVPVLLQVLKTQGSEFSPYEIGDVVAAIGKDAVPDLISALSEEDPQHLIPKMLGRVGESAIPALVQLLRERRDATLVGGAVEALGWVGPSARSAVQAILDVADVGGVFQQPEALERVGKDALPLLFEALEEDKTVRTSAVPRWKAMLAREALARMGRDAVPGLVRALGYPQSRQNAQEPLLSICRKYPDVTSLLTQTLKDADLATRVAAAELLVQCGGAAGQAALPILCASLKDKDPLVREKAARGLGNLWAGARESSDALLQAMAEKEDHVRTEAATALGKIWAGARESPPLKRVVTLLAKVVSEKQDSYQKRRSVDALGRIGPGARSAVPALVLALKDTGGEPPVSRLAMAALGRMGPAAADAVPPLLRLREDGDKVAREALELIIPPRKESLPTLIQALKDKDPVVRRAAAHDLGALGVEGVGAASALERTLNDGDATVRKAALEALEKVRKR